MMLAEACDLGDGGKIHRGLTNKIHERLIICYLQSARFFFVWWGLDSVLALTLPLSGQIH